MHKNAEKLLNNINNIETIKIIETAIFRLNSKDDMELIMLLDKLKIAFINNDKESITDEFIKNIEIKMKKILKDEWEKVKIETKKGKSNNDRQKFEIWN